MLGKHKLCDHDLKTNSKIYGGSDSEFVDCLTCSNGYKLTDELNWSTQRTTKYYAIAGIDYETSLPTSNDNLVEISTTFSTFDNIYDELQEKTGYGLRVVQKDVTLYINIKNVGDNVVEFLSQIGCTKSGSTPNKKIDFERIFVNIDTNGGNCAPFDNHLHGKMPHRETVIEKVGEFLRD